MFAMIYALFLTSWLSANILSANDEPDWGEAEGGLQIRVRTLAPEMAEKDIQLKLPDDSSYLDSEIAAASDYHLATDLSLLVELKNVSEEPISLQGVRYGDNVTAPARGSRASATFGPFLFQCNFYDDQGQLLNPPGTRNAQSTEFLQLTGGHAEMILPGETLLVNLRPIGWDASLVRLFEADKYEVEVLYMGTPSDSRTKIAEHWPENELLDTWSGEIRSQRVPFTIQSGYVDQAPELFWGEPVGGFRVAAEYRLVDRRTEDVKEFASRIFPIDTSLAVRFHIQNVSDNALDLTSDVWRQMDDVFLVQSNGAQERLTRVWRSGLTPRKTWNVQPGQIIVIPASSLDVVTESGRRKNIAGVGKHRILHKLNDLNLSTGVTTIRVRSRKPADEPAKHTARLRFHASDGRAITGGYAVVREQAARGGSFEGKFEGDSLEIPDCSDGPLRVYVRISGLEEKTFHRVSHQAASISDLQLAIAKPIRMKLIDRRGDPIPNARVRHFLRSKKLASVGPYPMKGLKGEVWATSDATGQVVIDSAEKLDPDDRKLGNNIYYFYIEPPKLGPLFIGPVEAGEDLGSIVVGPLISVTGRIEGTEQELKDFRAEWDQPEDILRGDRTNSWVWAQSKRLETRRVGDHLEFKLDDLRPGKLRIIGNFKGPPRSTSHTYSRRDPSEDDVVFEVDLQESTDSLVIKNTKRTKN